MFETKALGIIKRILQSIHQPLPLSKRDSNALIKILTTSFRKQLDREHGPCVQSGPVEIPRRVPKQQLSPNARHGVDHHLSAILQNPLFSYAPKPTRDVHDGVPYYQDLGDRFDAQAAKGQVDIRIASDYLGMVSRSLNHEYSKQPQWLSRKQAMAESGAGSRVLSWLRASGLARDLSFIENPPFTIHLVRFLVAEGKNTVVWSWLGQLIERGEPNPVPGKMSRSSVLLQALLDAESYYGKTLDRAYSAILTGVDMLRDAPGFPNTITVPWQRLSWLSTVLSSRKKTPSSSLFDAFFAISSEVPGARGLDTAHLMLHHPESPDYRPAVDFLRSRDGNHLVLSDWGAAPQESPALSRKMPSYRHWLSAQDRAVRVRSFVADTVQHLRDRGQLEELESVYEMLGPATGVRSLPA